MILNLILATCIALFAYLLRESTKENRKLANEHTSYNIQVKRLLCDLDNVKRELDRLLERNSYLESKLITFSKENEMLGKKNDELTQLHSLAKEEANKLKFKMIETEESKKPKAPIAKLKEVKTSKAKPRRTFTRK